MAASASTVRRLRSATWSCTTTQSSPKNRAPTCCARSRRRGRPARALATWRCSRFRTKRKATFAPTWLSSTSTVRRRRAARRPAPRLHLLTSSPPPSSPAALRRRRGVRSGGRAARLPGRLRAQRAAARAARRGGRRGDERAAAREARAAGVDDVPLPLRAQRSRCSRATTVEGSTSSGATGVRASCCFKESAVQRGAANGAHNGAGGVHPPPGRERRAAPAGDEGDEARAEVARGVMPAFVTAPNWASVRRKQTKQLKTRRTCAIVREWR